MDWLFWSLAAGSVGIVVHAHDFLLQHYAGVRPETAAEWLISAAGFATKFALAALGGFLLWVLWMDPEARPFAIGGAAVGMVVWIVEVAVTGWIGADAPTWVRCIMAARQLVTRLVYGLAGGAVLSLIFG